MATKDAKTAREFYVNSVVKAQQALRDFEEAIGVASNYIDNTVDDKNAEDALDRAGQYFMDITNDIDNIDDKLKYLIDPDELDEIESGLRIDNNMDPKNPAYDEESDDDKDLEALCSELCTAKTNDEMRGKLAEIINMVERLA